MPHNDVLGEKRKKDNFDYSEFLLLNSFLHSLGLGFVKTGRKTHIPQ